MTRSSMLMLTVVWWAVGASAQEVPADLEPVLQRLESAGKGLEDMRGGVVFHVAQEILEEGDEPEFEAHYGTFKLYRREGAGLTWIHFEKSTDGTVWHEDDARWFIFDGRDLIECREKEQRRIVHHVVQGAERVDPFKLGDGPFPLPFGQTRQDMVTAFELQRLPSPAEGIDRVAATPRRGTSLAERYRRIVLDIDGSGLPVRIELEDYKDQTTKTVTFKDLSRNGGLRPADFEIPREARGWQEVDG